MRQKQKAVRQAASELRKEIPEMAKVACTERNRKREPSWRFPVHGYLAQYATPSSTKFKQRATVLYTIVEGLLKHRNGGRWSKCCHVLERRVTDGCLGHPEGQTISLRDLITEEGIHNEDDFRRYLLRTLPRSSDGLEILLPQVNMKHRGTSQVSKDDQKLPAFTVEHELRAEVIGLKVMMEELMAENQRLKSELADLRSVTEEKHRGYLEYQGQHLALETKLADMESLLAAYSLQIKEIREDKDDAVAECKIKQEEFERLLNSCLPSVQQQRTEDKFFSIESSTLYQDMLKKNKSKLYDPEGLDTFSLNWQSLEQPPNTYRSPLSQLMSLKKRAPETK